MNKTLIGIFAAIIFAAGAVLVFYPQILPFQMPVSTNETVNNQTETNLPVDANGNAETSMQGGMLARNYYQYTVSDYQQLRGQEKPVLLYFYANWCPTCAAQEPIMVKAMNDGVSNGVVALRVNYNDTDTDESEKALAQEFSITYQHTFVLLDAGGEVVDIINGQQSAADLKKLFAKLN